MSSAELLRVPLVAPFAPMGSTLQLRLRHPYHLFGDLIRFLFINVTSLSDFKFELIRP